MALLHGGYLPALRTPLAGTPGPFQPVTARAEFRCQSQDGSSSDSSSGDEKLAPAPLSRRAAVLSASVGLPLALVSDVPGPVPLPGVQRRAGQALAASDGKTRNLSLEELTEIIAGDIRDRQYFVTGDMSKAIYRDDCYFIDPMNEVGGLDNYILGISLFLDPSCASNELIAVSSTEPNIIEATSKLSGYFRYVPWKPYLSPITVNTRYTVDSEGLISLHEEKWSISNPEAWRITLTPAFAQQKEICSTYQKQ